MNRLIRFFLFSFCFLIPSFVVTAESYFETNVSWSDEFRWGSSVNEKYWNIEERVCSTESQVYVKSKENAHCKYGLLHIKCIKRDIKDRKCTSARLNTKGKQSFLYGKIEVRAKSPVGKGIFPAIWMLPLDSRKPYGELDLMEYIDCWEGKKIQTNVHVVYEFGVKQYQHQKRIEIDVAKWHIYSLEWYKDKLVYLIDGNVVHQLRKDELEAWPFDRPYYLYLNVAFGGWGGSCGIDYDILPKEMLVDYVRYYKLKE